jgi:hypothetical protein
MIKNIEEILKSISSDVLTEEAKKVIATTFNEAVEQKVKSQAEILVEAELAKMDDDHTKKMKALIEAIDEDHTNKFKTIIQKLDEAHTIKLQKVIEKYEKELKEGAESLRGELIQKMSNYLDLYLKDIIPDGQLKEAVENIRARKMVDEIKKIIAVDPEFISENFKEALKDGHDTIEKLREELNAKIQENVNINQVLITTKSQMLVEQKTRDLPENKKKYVAKLLEGKKPEEIESNFKFIVEMYEKDEADRVATITESAKNESKTVANKVDAPKAEIKESIQSGEEKPVDAVAGYLEGLK